MRKTLTCLVTTLVLCVPLLSLAQDKDTYRTNRDRATQIAANIERSIKSKEMEWRLKDASPEDFGFHQYWRSGKREIRVSISVYNSPEEASNTLQVRSRTSSVAFGEKLDDFGEEAYYLTHRYFGAVGVRKGRTYVEVHAPSLVLAKQFAQYALEQIQEQ